MGKSSGGGSSVVGIFVAIGAIIVAIVATGFF